MSQSGLIKMKQDCLHKAPGQGNTQPVIAAGAIWIDNRSVVPEAVSTQIPVDTHRSQSPVSLLLNDKVMN